MSWLEDRYGSVKWALSMVLVSLTWSLPASAQEFRGSIVGKVTDSTGGVLPGVTVVVSNNDTKVAQTLVTDGQGVYPRALSERRHVHGHRHPAGLQEDVAACGPGHGRRYDAHRLHAANLAA